QTTSRHTGLALAPIDKRRCQCLGAWPLCIYRKRQGSQLDVRARNARTLLQGAYLSVIECFGNSIDGSAWDTRCLKLLNPFITRSGSYERHQDVHQFLLVSQPGLIGRKSLCSCPLRVTQLSRQLCKQA